ncbi:unnamed protein product [Arabis nemorensis]|uniref:Uncharacterized protein n=1 Tax=Arabis nemorensis TaxID=586526 RepID=A0A565BE03_9BRAS|nr:unnamed protein product [Arabis nemorensis]
MTEQLYKQVDGGWTEAESVPKSYGGTGLFKCEKMFSAATEESASSSGTETSEGEKQQEQQSGTTEEQHTLFGQFKLSFSSPKMQGYPVFKCLSGMSEPVVSKGQEIAEDVIERWETSDNPIVHKIQDMNETIFSGNRFCINFQRNMPPSSGDIETLKKYCSKEVIERCTVERAAFQSHGSRDKDDGKFPNNHRQVLNATNPLHWRQGWRNQRRKRGHNTHGVLRLGNAAELGEEAIYPIWKLREMQRIGVQALI